MTECYACAKLAELRAENNALRAANDMKATESDVRTLGVDANDVSVDTREKLEADVCKFANVYYADHLLVHEKVMELLDRQAAITERHWMEIVGASANANVELKRQIDERQARVDELTEQLEAAHAKNRSLRTHISKMQEGRHGWHVKGVELQREVDKLARENISLARDLSECMAERDSWRYRWHQVRVLMDEPLQCDRATLVDIDGEVVG